MFQLLAALDCPSEEFGRYLGPWEEVERLLRYQGAAAAELAAGAG